MSVATIQIGTSGWHYPHWRGRFYPESLPSSEQLVHYARFLSTVEINNSFYQLPPPDTLAHWRDRTPDTFLFAFKASRYLTHMKKLKDGQEPLDRLLERAAELGDKLGPVLFQLPPRWRCNVERLAEFLACLPPAGRYAFEFRDPSWFTPAVYRCLGDHDAAFCIYEIEGRLSPKELTAGFVYVRLHGPGAAYQGCYDVQALAGWAGALSSWQRQGRDIYCYFDNDENAYAVGNARRLQEMLNDGV